ncbi:hypothetical protein NEMIN01_1068 [Nematocida minor]|uniref:uncharacterized protein n=1 Tax=Nematocida minor TaxID=1912983 RepID=UPI00222000DE|nr:uncharacterized protein NEMIN01_1068 [Nematocida minor]KAI5190530.1 hypothetical protein NEMIN01_1068 [Nematocida minor]
MIETNKYFRLTHLQEEQKKVYNRIVSLLNHWSSKNTSGTYEEVAKTYFTNILYVVFIVSSFEFLLKFIVGLLYKTKCKIQKNRIVYEKKVTAIQILLGLVIQLLVNGLMTLGLFANIYFPLYKELSESSNNYSFFSTCFLILCGLSPLLVFLANKIVNFLLLPLTTIVWSVAVLYFLALATVLYTAIIEIPSVCMCLLDSFNFWRSTSAQGYEPILILNGIYCMVMLVLSSLLITHALIFIPSSIKKYRIKKRPIENRKVQLVQP